MTLRFTLRQIHYFVAVAEFGSISRASERLHISPPSLSAAIAQLETAFGIRLFIRQHSLGLSLTGEGRRLLGDAKQLLTQATAMHRSANEISHELRGPLSVGCHITFAAMVLPSIRRSVEVAHRNISWTSTIADQSALVEKLRAGEIDVALIYDLGIPKDLEFEPLAQLKAHAILAADHHLAAKPSVSLQELAQLPFILLDQPLSREYFLGLFEAARVVPQIVDRVSDSNLLRSMVASGVGYSLANVRPLNAAAQDGKAILVKPLTNAHVPVSIGVASAGGSFRPKAVSAFFAQCRRLIHDDVIPGMARSPDGQIVHKLMSLAG